MARVFYDGIIRASSTISAPADGVSNESNPDIYGQGSTTCEKVPGNAIGPVKTQAGSGTSDGAYTHGSQVSGTYNMINFGGGGNSSNLHWADVSFFPGTSHLR
jgi:hypothetical protein